MQSGSHRLGKDVMIVGVRMPEEFPAAFAQLEGMAGPSVAERRIHAVSDEQAGAARRGSAKPLALEQEAMSISRYIVVAVARFSRACSN